MNGRLIPHPTLTLQQPMPGMAAVVAEPQRIPRHRAPASNTEELSPLVLLEMLEHRRFGVEYQPIRRSADLSLYGWEALARFRTGSGETLPPDRVFAGLHGSPLALLYVEQAMKRLQIERAPAQGKLFLNLDPDSWEAGGAEAFLPLFLNAGERVVVEIIENISSRDLELSQAMAFALEENGIPVALDDVGSEGALFSYSAFAGASYLKLDKSWLRGGEKDRAAKALLSRALIQAAKQLGIATLLEGVENSADLATARELGADFVQGFLFANEFVRAI